MPEPDSLPMSATPNTDPDRNEELAWIVKNTTAVPTTSMVPDNIGKIETAEDEYGGKTEWEDALIKKGIMAKPAKQITEDELHELAREALEERNPHESKTLEELQELEDDLPEDTLEGLKRKRLAELQAEAKRNQFGEVVEIYQQDFVREVTEASESVTVILHLYANGKHACELLNLHMTKLARRFRAIKFLKARGSDIMPNFPDRECPTVLIYDKGDMRRTINGLTSWGGSKISADSIEYRLGKMGFLETDIQEDPLLVSVRTRMTEGEVTEGMNIYRNELAHKKGHAELMEIDDAEFDDLSD